MSATRIEDLANVEVEHLLGLATGLPLVKLRCESEGTVLVGQIPPAAARSIAMHLMECAARAEYEHDLMLGAQSHNVPQDEAIRMCVMVRDGERMRHMGGPS